MTRNTGGEREGLLRQVTHVQQRTINCSNKDYTTSINTLRLHRRKQIKMSKHHNKTYRI